MNLNKRRLLGILLLVLDLLWIAFIIMRSLQPADNSDKESALFLTLLQRLFPQITMHIVRKLAHFTEFFLLGGLLGLSCAVLWRPMLWQPLLGGVLVAACDETVQLFVVGRSGQLKDVALDSAGVLTALLLLWLLLYMRKKCNIFPKKSSK